MILGIIGAIQEALRFLSNIDLAESILIFHFYFRGAILIRMLVFHISDNSGVGILHHYFLKSKIFNISRA
jgi:hypothetical protein